MEPRTVAALLTLGVLVLCDMTSVVLAYDDGSDIAELDDLDADDDFIEAAMIRPPKFADAKATQQQQTYKPEKLKCNEPNVANSKSSDGLKIDFDTYRMLREDKDKADKNRLLVDEEFLKRKHTARAEVATQRRDKRQGEGGGSSCPITNQTFINRTFTNRSFNNCTFTNCNFNNCTFDNCTFTGSSFINCNFPSCTFNNCSFINCNFTKCNFTNCNFNNRPFINCTFSYVNFAPPFPHT